MLRTIAVVCCLLACRTPEDSHNNSPAGPDWTRVPDTGADWICSNREGCSAWMLVDDQRKEYRFEHGDILSTEGGWIVKGR